MTTLMAADTTPVRQELETARRTGKRTTGDALAAAWTTWGIVTQSDGLIKPESLWCREDRMPGKQALYVEERNQDHKTDEYRDPN